MEFVHLFKVIAAFIVKKELVSHKMSSCSFSYRLAKADRFFCVFSFCCVFCLGGFNHFVGGLGVFKKQTTFY